MKMLKQISFIVYSFILLYSIDVNAQQCSNLGGLNVYYDPTCAANGGAGCNAGGQGMNCRFCGYSTHFPFNSYLIRICTHLILQF
jgi:hypothetical protein